MKNINTENFNEQKELLESLGTGLRIKSWNAADLFRDPEEGFVYWEQAAGQIMLNPSKNLLSLAAQDSFNYTPGMDFTDCVISIFFSSGKRDTRTRIEKKIKELDGVIAKLNKQFKSVENVNKLMRLNEAKTALVNAGYSLKARRDVRKTFFTEALFENSAGNLHKNPDYFQTIQRNTTYALNTLKKNTVTDDGVHLLVEYEKALKNGDVSKISALRAKTGKVTLKDRRITHRFSPEEMMDYYDEIRAYGDNIRALADGLANDRFNAELSGKIEAKTRELMYKQIELQYLDSGLLEDWTGDALDIRFVQVQKEIVKAKGEDKIRLIQEEKYLRRQLSHISEHGFYDMGVQENLDMLALRGRIYQKPFEIYETIDEKTARKLIREGNLKNFKLIPGQKIQVIRTYEVANQTTSNARQGKTIAIRNKVEILTGGSRAELPRFSGLKEVYDTFDAGITDLIAKDPDGMYLMSEVASRRALGWSAIDGSKNGGLIKSAGDRKVVLKDVFSRVGINGVGLTVGADGKEIMKPINESMLNLWDGMCLAEKSLFGDRDSSFYLLRSSCFKSLAVPVDLKAVYKDAWKKSGIKKSFETTTLGELFDAMGQSRELILDGEDVLLSNIEIISTESSEKMLGFSKVGEAGSAVAKAFPDAKTSMEKWREAHEKAGNSYSIVKIEHSSQFRLEDEMAQLSSYQGVQAYNLGKTTDEIKEALDGIVSREVSFLQRSLSTKSGRVEVLEKMAASEFGDVKDTAARLLSVSKRNSDVLNTDECTKLLKGFVEKRITAIRTEGRLLLEGDNQVIVGNPFSMLKNAIGQLEVDADFVFKGKSEFYKLGMEKLKELRESGDYRAVADPIFVYDGKPTGTLSMATRSPLTGRKNLALQMSVDLSDSEYMKYFEAVGEKKGFQWVDGTIVDLSTIHAGSDYDGDMCFVSYNDVLVNTTQDSYGVESLAVNQMDSDKKRVKGTMKSKAELDHATANINIGKVANKAQVLNSQADTIGVALADGQKKLDEVNARIENILKGIHKKSGSGYVTDYKRLMDAVGSRNLREQILADKEGMAVKQWLLRNDVYNRVDILSGASIDAAKRSYNNYSVNDALSRIDEEIIVTKQMKEAMNKSGIKVELGSVDPWIRVSTDKKLDISGLSPEKLVERRDFVQAFQDEKGGDIYTLVQLSDEQGAKIMKPLFMKTLNNSEGKNYCRSFSNMDILNDVVRNVKVKSKVKDSMDSVSIQDILIGTGKETAKVKEFVNGIAGINMEHSVLYKQLESGMLSDSQFYDELSNLSDKAVRAVQKAKFNEAEMSWLVANIDNLGMLGKAKSKVMNALYKADPEGYMSLIKSGFNIASETDIVRNVLTLEQMIHRRAVACHLDIKRMYEDSVKSYVQDMRSLLSHATSQMTPEEAEEFLKGYMTDKKRIQFGTGGYIHRMTMRDKLFSEMEAMLSQVQNRQVRLMREALKGIIGDSYNGAMDNAGRSVGMSFAYGGLDEQKIRQILEKPLFATHFEKRIAHNIKIYGDSLKEVLILGSGNGLGIDRMAQILNEKCGYGVYQSKRLIMTESAFYSNQASLQAYEDAFGEDEFYLFIATLDSRTSKLCQEMDGKKFKLKDAVAGKNCPPLHPFCRSVIAMLPDEETLKDMTRRIRTKDGKEKLIPFASYRDLQASGQL